MQPAARRRVLWGSHLVLLAIGLFLGGWGMWQAMGRGWIALPPGTPMARPGTVVIAEGTPPSPAAPAATPAENAPAIGTPVAPVGEATALSAPASPVASAAAPAPVVPAAGASLLIPVAGVQASQLVDTYTQSRSEGRTHEAIDIMAPTGTPVHAVADGHVEKLFESRLGGITLYQFDVAQQRAYYYAHLNGYAPGIAEKRQVRRGELLGYVGFSGNANPAAPHLHFAVFDLGPEKKWWKGTAVNPYPLLSGLAPAAAEGTPVPQRSIPGHRMQEGSVEQLQQQARRLRDKVPAGVRP